MKRIVFIVVVFSLLIAFTLVQNRNIPSVKASSSVYQGDLILNENNVTTIEGKFVINGSIIVEENATLILENAIISFTQTKDYEHNLILRNPVNGNPRLQSKNSTITSDFRFVVYIYDNSSASIYDSTNIPYLRTFDSSSVSITNSAIGPDIGGSGGLSAADSSVVSVFNSTINTLVATKFPVVSVYNSTIGLLILNSAGVNCSFVSIGSVHNLYAFWDYHLNSSVTISSDGWAPKVTVRNTKIDRWQLGFQLNSNVTITNSTLFRLYPSYSNVWLINSTSGLLGFTGWGRVYILWYLDVHVIDSIGQDVPSANVTAAFPDLTLAESKTTDAQGWARLALMEKMINATGEYPFGNYTVEATYLTYSNSTTVNMTDNQQITLTLEDFIIPEFPAASILPLFMLLSLIIVVLAKRRTSNKPKLSM